MLDKKSCVACHQKHESQWEEEVWKDGYVTCPSECFSVTHYDRVVSNDEIGGNLFVKSVFGFRETSDAPPVYCDFAHTQGAEHE